MTTGIKLAFGRLILLSDDEVVRIHETSLKKLQEIGMKVLSKKVQSLLAEKGAEVDASRSIVKIPSSLVEEAIKKAPKEITLCGRNPKSDLKLPTTDFPFVAPNGCTTFMMHACMHVPLPLEEEVQREINQILRNCEKEML